MGPALTSHARGGYDRLGEDDESLSPPDAVFPRALGVPGPEGGVAALRPVPGPAGLGAGHARIRDAVGRVESHGGGPGPRGHRGDERASLPRPGEHERLDRPRGADALRGYVQTLALREPSAVRLLDRAPVDGLDRLAPARRLRDCPCRPESAGILRKRDPRRTASL